MSEKMMADVQPGDLAILCQTFGPNQIVTVSRRTPKQVFADGRRFWVESGREVAGFSVNALWLRSATAEQIAGEQRAATVRDAREALRNVATVHRWSDEQVLRVWTVVREVKESLK